MRRLLVTILLAGLAVTGAPAARADGTHGAVPATQPPTRFEAFVADACAPCVTDSWTVATLTTPAQRLPGFAPQVLNVMGRAGEVRLEAVRAHSLGRATQRFLAMRVVLSVAGGGGQLYRFGAGLLDEEDLPRFTAAVADLARALASTPSADPPPTSSEVEYHAGSVRVGAVRLQGAAGAYVQAGDVHALPVPTAVEASAALFFPPDDLRALLDALGQVAERLGRLRAR
jgi:hypothetical protein